MELINKICEVTDSYGNKSQVTTYIENALQIITNTLVSGEDVTLSGLGNFIVTERKERMGRNPRTGESIKIAATRKVSFKPAKSLRDSLHSK